MPGWRSARRQPAAQKSRAAADEIGRRREPAGDLQGDAQRCLVEPSLTEQKGVSVTAPFIVINTYAIKEGELEGFRRFLQELFEVLEANDPGLRAINAYANEHGTEAAIVQVHPHAASVKRYWQVVHQHTGRTLGQFVNTTTSFQVYGTPSDVVLKRASQNAESAVAVCIKPEHLGGFTRLVEAAR